MATDTGGASVDVSPRELLLSVADSYRHMDIPLSHYLGGILLPAFLFAVGSLGAVVFASLPLAVGAPLGLLGALLFVSALFYPKVIQDRKRKEIRERFHLFLTHITVLSMTNIDRVEVFRTLANVEEYGALAEEMGRVVALVDTWNQSLDDACRLRSKKVPSELLSDFFERLAYSVGAGQPMGEFLVDEQDSIIQQFVIRYESDLAKMDVLKELYLSLMLSTTFILVFATVLPILLGVPPTLLVGGVVAMFAVVQSGFLFVIHTVAPWDPVWLTADGRDTPASGVRTKLVVGMGLSFVAALAVGAVVAGRTPLAPDVLPRPVYVAVAVTPLVVPGLAMRREEERVKDRDEGFPSFVRALGSIESVKQTSTANVLATLRTKDFGALTRNVDNLYKRLNTRIDSEESWRLFAVESGSYLIQKFGEMYVVGRRMGGEPKRLGQIISKNLSTVLQVREQRDQATRTFIGVIYGITAAAIFSAFIGLEIAQQMVTITSDIAEQNNQIMPMLFNSAMYDVEVIQFLLLAVVLVNALLSSLMIRLMDRGHPVNAYVHFVALTWVGALTSVVTQLVIGGLVTL